MTEVGGRLGARYTVKGYLRSVERWSLLGFNDSGRYRVEDYARGLPRKWRCQLYCDEFLRFCDPYGWDTAQSDGKNVLGPSRKLIASLPYATVNKHFESASDSSTSEWEEGLLTCHIWDQKIRRGKAIVDAMPSSVFLSYHALLRLYERTGGCAFQEFPSLVAKCWSELLRNLFKLVVHSLWRRDAASGTIGFAVPLMGGLGIFQMQKAMINRFNPALGIKFRINGQQITGFGKASFNIVDWFGAAVEQDPEEEEIINLPVAVMRTFLGFEDLSDRQRDTLFLTEQFLNYASENSYSVLEAAKSGKDATGRRLMSMPEEKLSLALVGLKADVQESLSWIKGSRDELIVIC
ncbi:hypothetical protein [Altererythrobacter rubellus]|uniref:Uncharacterized protein n=1 Tax=Altererythrobacter rubellus TaxID=2173831 RepID=A0A9Y2F8Z8_9SPHN|nr:hypothetical protein [Altererythrobacter rubellus]WIW95471.1 hypothetical protein QQX03_11135 [Altererythrobacter rubellus]